MSRLPLHPQLDLHCSIPHFPRGREAALDGHVLSLVVTVLSDDSSETVMIYDMNGIPHIENRVRFMLFFLRLGVK